ncbi:ribbon-helix-helix domain-containing protein [Aliiroseovarius crassostreae]|uniref:ribbon-helix-helix domain-containing protein n=1 Tax=Aliiroseovarius crassostreae TaxID=154981 RepID=UPI0022094232|nr:ribbon-helix-helix domain-containing protein [Aliiroseovarius crassostreae]UWQ05236.1 ribbon-helix-helix domain-containing protein [Aliiroseovarius crassostreae]
MCRLFVGADTSFWESNTRVFRVDGTLLSLEIENFYWDVLDRIARRDGMNTEQLVNTLYFEAIDADHTEGSFASFLRVCCGRFLDLLQKGEIPDDETPIRELDADAILERENQPRLRVVHEA